ncbi:type IV fimbriae assembly protein [Litchfieldella qijiaojingensis]|uniref:Type IV fimbriae assembly protein n=1 Tax=Litchfieldella qijiaojingensis TaxID=980347 RepID=A0ABQ2YES0_9GAMM|nr:PilZ domain-containing protein [Halomonas qijiaojingensis]GGX81283.1 type IV fimbriae assembly protein [Halomonas qijiaojingensis]
MAGQETLSLTIQDAAALLSAYMPWLERGGIFLPTKEHYPLGQDVFLLLTLPGENERLPVTGQVVWVSPPGVSGRRIPGIGIQFRAEDQAVRDRIETHLAGHLDKGASTYTL